MHLAHRRTYAQAAIARLSFNDFIRKGRSHAGTRSLADALSSDIYQKFNPNHDPQNGQFTSGGASSSVGVRVHVAPKTYQAATLTGIGFIKPVGGGYFDANDRYIPEIFAPDPLALTDPASALAHYVGRSGEPRNYYFNALDTSKVEPTSFPEIQNLISSGKPGLYEISGAQAAYDSGVPFSPDRLSAATTVGRLSLATDGVLAISETGQYSYNGSLRSLNDIYKFNPSFGRTKLGEFSTMVGRAIPGVEFDVYVIGSKPFSGSGYVQLQSR